MHSSKKGFTLAEVLVTLAIIGVVAALTIPTLIQSTSNDKYKVGLKKTLGSLNQALMSVSVDGTTIPTTGAESGTALASFFSPALNSLKVNADTMYLSDGTKITFVGTTTGGCPLITGATVFNSATDCYALVDVNGDKGPNTAATNTTFNDIYVLGISANGVVPLALNNTTTLTLTGSNFRNDINGTIITGSTAYPATMVPGSASMNVMTGATTAGTAT